MINIKIQNLLIIFWLQEIYLKLIYVLLIIFGT